jgi:predicted AAA+ superfamily ATPase
VVFLHLKTIGYTVLIGTQNEKEVDFVAERANEKIYIQVALRISEKQTSEREFGNLLAIKDNYPKYVITLDDYAGNSFEGVVHVPLHRFLLDFA